MSILNDSSHQNQKHVTPLPKVLWVHLHCFGVEFWRFQPKRSLPSHEYNGTSLHLMCDVEMCQKYI